MSELFKVLGKESAQPKVHTVIIQGRSIVVTLEKKLEVLKHGEDAYVWKSPTEFILKQKLKPKTRYSILCNAEKGYKFEQNDIHWPNEVVQGGMTWLIEQE